LGEQKTIQSIVGEGKKKEKGAGELDKKQTMGGIGRRVGFAGNIRED